MGAPTTRPDETFFAVEGLDYAHWCPSASCPEKQGMQDILLGLKEEKGFSYEVNHVRWEIEEGPDLHAMMVGPIDGPLDRDGQDWPEEPEQEGRGHVWDS